MRRALPLCLLLLGCTAPPAEATSFSTETAGVESMALDVDLTTRQARATIVAAPGDGGTLALEAAGLHIDAVHVDGHPVTWSQEGGLRVEGLEGTTTLEVDYGFDVQSQGDGYLAQGMTLLWPYHCGNLFPCVSAPHEGLTFELSVTGTPGGETTIAPAAIPTDAPAYMLGWATGEFTEVPLGATTAGTEVFAWHLPGSATSGFADLTAVVDHFEQRLGAYAFGTRVGSVEAAWGGGAYGGMEHHPYWHVGSQSWDDDTTHAHEAAHGWFGNGVRPACWEDFVLSEGTVSYLTAHALDVVAGRGDAIWERYQSRLNSAMATASMKIAWPEGCNAIDILDDGLFSSIPYMKGAFFFRALERRIGVDALLDALSAFYLDHVGKAATMQQLLDAIALRSGYDANACARSWLREEAVPDFDACP